MSLDIDMSMDMSDNMSVQVSVIEYVQMSNNQFARIQASHFVSQYVTIPFSTHVSK